MIHCENCRYWANGYCTLRHQETKTAQVATKQRRNKMNKEDVKRMLRVCIDPVCDSKDCDNYCDYHDYDCCQDYLCRDALFVIEDLELELKQGKIDVLNDVKKRIYDISPYNPLVTKDDVKRFIEKLIKEVQNENTKT